MVLLPYKGMSKQKERESAQSFRQKGMSISDIATKLKVSKSTVSTWCKDIVLSEEAIEIITRTSKSKSTTSLLRYTESLRAKRQENILISYEVGKKKVGKLSVRDIYCIGLGLYWGEGYKRGSQEFGFTNSDPRMIVFYLLWLHTVFKVNNIDLIARVSINSAHQSRAEEVEKYWSRTTRIPRSQFTKISFLKSQSKKVYTNTENYYGTLRVKVRRGTTMRREVLGAIVEIGESA
jgi:transcriptional regulator with XRE-family HTH domain